LIIQGEVNNSADSEIGFLFLTSCNVENTFQILYPIFQIVICNITTADNL